MIVSCFGHRDLVITNELKEKMQKQIELCVQEGACNFYCGGMGSVDCLFASTVKVLQKKNPELKLYLILPYPNVMLQTYEYDGFIYPPIEKTPAKYAIIKRNQWMIEQSDVIISCVKHLWGGANHAVEYARKKGKRIICLL